MRSLARSYENASLITERCVCYSNGSPGGTGTLQLFKLATHILPALSFCRGRVSHRGNGTVCAAEPWPMACQSQEWVSVFAQRKFLPALLFSWLELVFSSFIWKKQLWQQLLSCCSSWRGTISLRLRPFGGNCLPVGQNPGISIPVCQSLGLT